MDAMIPKQVPEARFVLTYQQSNITRNVSLHLLSLTYSDFLTGEADSLEVELEDTEGKWRGAWYPGHGDTLSLAIGWEGESLRTLGRFEIDEVELNCPPSTITIHALATGIKASLRTTEHRAYESTTLDAIAKQVAAAGMLGGNYLIMSAQHRMTRSGGYTVDQSLCRISAPSISMTQDSTKPDLALSIYGIQREVVA
ncbi:hypothetical protein [Pseudomonas fluorescens]|uniref:hypothetical protein n=1 Tax=Pseudomonas fluorescens TaxID=294 RepID=UPI000642526C|nr:hypothetical protein [Pseudomonas fluorescens]